MKTSRVLFAAVFSLLALAASAQTVTKAISSTQCAEIAISPSAAVVGMQIVGTWTGTLQPQASIQGLTPFDVEVTPSASTTPQATITVNGMYFAQVAGYSSFLLCGDSVASGTAIVYLLASQAPAASLIAFSGSSIADLAVTNSFTAPDGIVWDTSGITGQPQIVATGDESGLTITGITGFNAAAALLVFQGAYQGSTDRSIASTVILNCGNATTHAVTAGPCIDLSITNIGGGTLNGPIGMELTPAASGATNQSGFVTDPGFDTPIHVQTSASTGVSKLDSGVQASIYQTTTACAANGTAANPSVVACSAASAGSLSCATAASSGTCQVNTTAVTAGSQIFVSQDASLGTLLSVTCNTANVVSTTAPLIASRSAGASFTINLGTVTTNPACFSYWIVN